MNPRDLQGVKSNCRSTTGSLTSRDSGFVPFPRMEQRCWIHSIFSLLDLHSRTSSCPDDTTTNRVGNEGSTVMLASGLSKSSPFTSSAPCSFHTTFHPVGPEDSVTARVFQFFRYCADTDFFFSTEVNSGISKGTTSLENRRGLWLPALAVGSNTSSQRRAATEQVEKGTGGGAGDMD